MKHKIFIQVLIMVVMFILAALLYENAPIVAEALGASVRSVESLSAGMAMATIFPSMTINQIQKGEKQL